MSDIVTITTTLVPDDVTLTVNPLIDEVTVNVTTVTDQVTVVVSNEVGPQGPAGSDYDPATSWIGLATGASNIGGETPVVYPAVGFRLTYTYSGAITRYRFYTDDGAQDAFYSDAALTNLIVSRFF